MKGRVRLFFIYLNVLGLKRIANYLLIKLSVEFSRICKRDVFWGNPFAVTIETVTGCNLRCPGCELGAGKLERPNTMIDTADFFIALRSLPYSVFHVNLHFQGEPILHPSLPKMIRLARQSKLVVSFSTNGTLITKKIAKSLVLAGTSHIILSLDGSNQLAYESYRVNGQIQHVTDAIKYLRLYRKKFKRLTPVIEAQTVVTSYNEHQLNEIRKLAFLSGADLFTVKSAFVSDLSSVPPFFPDTKLFQRYFVQSDGTLLPKKSSPSVCFRSRSSVVVLNDLTVVPCCFDKNASIPLGNLKNSKFIEIWKGKAAKDVRKKLLFKKNIPEICKNCIQ